MKDIKDIGLIPLSNFGQVNSDHAIFRCAQPLFPYQYEWLKKVLGIDMVVNLRSEKDVDSRLGIPAGLSTVTISVPDHHAPTEKQALDFIKFIRNQKGSIVIHCEHGHGRTSTFSVLAKIALGMTLDEAIEDEHVRFHYEFRHKEQEEFLRNLDLTSVNTENCTS